MIKYWVKLWGREARIAPSSRGENCRVYFYAASVTSQCDSSDGFWDCVFRFPPSTHPLDMSHFGVFVYFKYFLHFIEKRVSVFFFSFFGCNAQAWGILVPKQRSNWYPLRWTRGVSTTEPSGKSPSTWTTLNTHTQSKISGALMRKQSLYFLPGTWDCAKPRLNACNLYSLISCVDETSLHKELKDSWMRSLEVGSLIKFFLYDLRLTWSRKQLVRVLQMSF